MSVRHDSGIVLRSYPFGEADRVVVLLSPDNGKLRTVAKGVRKTKSRFGGRLEPFTHVELVLYEGRNLDTITAVEVVSSYRRMREHLERITAAATMVEAVDAVAQEKEPSRALFDLLDDGLRALDEGPRGTDIVSAFLLQLAGVVGLAPALDACATCGRPEGLDRFSFAGGGVVCGRCTPEGSVRLRQGITEHLLMLASGRLDTVGAEDTDLSSDAMWVTRKFVEYHLDRRLASLAVLDS